MAAQRAAEGLRAVLVLGSHLVSHAYAGEGPEVSGHESQYLLAYLRAPGLLRAVVQGGYLIERLAVGRVERGGPLEGISLLIVATLRQLVPLLSSPDTR